MTRRKKKRETFKIHVPAERLGDPHLFVEGVCPSSGFVREIEGLSLKDCLMIARGWQKTVLKIERDAQIERDAHDEDLARRETEEF